MPLAIGAFGINTLNQQIARIQIDVILAGSLLLPSGHRVIDSPDFPEAYKAEASAGGDFLQALRQEQQLDWTFLSPSAEFVEGERSGHYTLGKDHLLIGADGKRYLDGSGGLKSLFNTSTNLIAMICLSNTNQSLPWLNDCFTSGTLANGVFTEVITAFTCSDSMM